MTVVRKTHRSPGFSLVEMVFALAICSFCLISIFALLPVGISTNRTSVEQTAAAGIARAVGADFWVAPRNATATPLFGIKLPASMAASTTPAQTLFMAADNSTNIATAARYRVDVAYGARSSAAQPLPVRILVTWPAVANQIVGQWPLNQSGSYEVVITKNMF